MTMRDNTFRWCMLIGAAALLGVSLYYFVTYAAVLATALGNSSVQPALQASIRAMWLAFGFQALLIGLMYSLVAFRPRAVSREVIVLLGLLQLVEAALLVIFAGGMWMAMLLAAAAACVLCGAIVWPVAPSLAVPGPAPATPGPPPPLR